MHAHGHPTTYAPLVQPVARFLSLSILPRTSILRVFVQIKRTLYSRLIERVGPTGESQPLLVMREQLKLVATPAAVRARDRRFRELLQAHAAAEPAAVAPAAAASTTDASVASACSAGRL